MVLVRILTHSLISSSWSNSSRMETPKTTEPATPTRRSSLGTKARRNIFQKPLTGQKSMPELVRKPFSRTKKSKSSSRLLNASFDEKCVKRLVLSPGDLPQIPSKKKLVFDTPIKKELEDEPLSPWSPSDPCPPPSPTEWTEMSPTAAAESD